MIISFIIMYCYVLKHYPTWLFYVVLPVFIWPADDFSDGSSDDADDGENVPQQKVNTGIIVFGHCYIHYYIGWLTDTNTYWRCTIHKAMIPTTLLPY